MYGTPADPTFNKALIRELRHQGKRCTGCRHNDTTPGDRHCRQGDKRWPDGPCVAWEAEDGD